MSALFAGLPRRMRSIAIRTDSRNEARPASSGGGVPAPGEYGLVIGSIDHLFIPKLAKLQYEHKLDNIHIITTGDRTDLLPIA